MKRLAVIDLGTNTFHLLVAEVGSANLQVLYKEKKSVKIGEHGISKGIISDAAQKRALAALKDFRNIMDRYDELDCFAFATSAFRNASNGIDLINTIRQQTGIEIKVIHGEKEAEYIYRGVKEALELGVKDSLIMDIGGGSVEFVIANEQAIKWKESYEIGAQRLMDQFHYHDPIHVEDIGRLEHYLDDQLATLITAMEQYNPRILVGSSGTFDTLSEIYCMDQGIQQTESPERLLSREGFQAIHEQIISLDRSQRMEIPGMIEMRVDMIVVASSLINYLLNRFQIDTIRVSAYALKEGALFELWDEFGDQQT